MLVSQRTGLAPTIFEKSIGTLPNWNSATIFRGLDRFSFFRDHGSWGLLLSLARLFSEELFSSSTRFSAKLFNSLMVKFSFRFGGFPKQINGILEQSCYRLVGRMANDTEPFHVVMT